MPTMEDEKPKEEARQEDKEVLNLKASFSPAPQVDRKESQKRYMITGPHCHKP